MYGAEPPIDDCDVASGGVLAPLAVGDRVTLTYRSLFQQTWTAWIGEVCGEVEDADRADRPVAVLTDGRDPSVRWVDANGDVFNGRLHGDHVGERAYIVRLSSDD